MRKLITTLITLACYALLTNAQVDGILKIGLSGYQGDLKCNTDENLSMWDQLGAAGGIGVRVPFNKVLGFRGEVTYLRLRGRESRFFDVGHVNRGWSFSNDIVEFSSIIDWEILGKRRYTNGKFKRFLTPVIFAGVGAAWVNANVDWNGSSHVNIPLDEISHSGLELIIPVGVELKYYHSDRWAFSLETSIRLPVSDYYDGVSLTANPNENDTYCFGGLKAFYRISGDPDTDKDGVPDKEDDCPTIPGPKELQGCPDLDKDGIPDKEDDCPCDPGVPEHKGCPDTDKDGIPDKLDKCPLIPGLMKFEGCPDTDGDGIEDSKDECPEEHGNGNPNGCPDKDTDGDGVIDPEDKCPDEFGETPDGCPKKENPDPPLVDAPVDLSPKGGDESTPDSTIVDPPIVEKTEPVCNCTENENKIFNIDESKRPRALTRLGTNPEFGNLHDLDPTGFYNKLVKAYATTNRDSVFLDDLFQAMGYKGFEDATPEMFSEVEIPYGTVGNIGYSKYHKMLYARLNSKLSRDLMAFRIKAANGCDIHFMKTCGNFLFFCNK